MSAEAESAKDQKIIYTGPSPRGWHRLQQAAECLQKYAWTYEAPKVESTGVKSQALAKGSLIHLALAQHYARIRASQKDPTVQLAELDDDRPESWCDPEEAVQLIAKLEGTEAYVQNTIDTYKAYCRIYPESGERQTMKILAVEDLLSGTIADKYLFTGRMDLVYEDLGGRIWVLDHKCLPGDAEVNGVSVRDLYCQGKEFAVCAMTEKQTLIDSLAKPPEDAGIQMVYGVNLANGLQLRLGYKHPVWTRRGDAKHNRYGQPSWVRADDLRKGDEVAVGLGSARYVSAQDTKVTDDECWMVGALLSDGTLTNEDFKLTKDDASVRKAYIQAAENYGFRVSEGFPVDKTPYVSTKGGMLLTSWSDKVGLTRVTSPERRIPALMRHMNIKQTGILLGALWSGDGAFYVSRGAGEPIPRITYGTRSLGLAKDVQQALLAVGVPSSLQSTSMCYNGKRVPYYFACVVTTFGKRKFCELAKEGTIPLVRSAVTVDAMMEVLLASGDRGNGKVEGDLWWVKVKQCLAQGEEQCYDIEVPQFNTFLVSGLVTHNTTARLTSSHTQYYSISGQLLGYGYLARKKYGDKFAGIKVNLIQHGDSPKFERITLPRSPNLESKFERIVVDIEEAIERMQASGREFDNWPKAINEMTCHGRYGACQFIDQCRNGYGSKKAGNWTWKDL